jgi:hypothetical protein
MADSMRGLVVIREDRVQTGKCSMSAERRVAQETERHKPRRMRI